MFFYKIVFGYDPEDYIQIDGDELEKATYCHLSGKKGVFTGGTISGDKIISIYPDLHRAMGYNRGWKLNADDYADIASKGIDRKHRAQQIIARDRVQYFIKQNTPELIGTGVATGIAELDSPLKLQAINNKKVDGSPQSVGEIINERGQQ